MPPLEKTDAMEEPVRFAAPEARRWRQSVARPGWPWFPNEGIGYFVPYLTHSDRSYEIDLNLARAAAPAISGASAVILSGVTPAIAESLERNHAVNKIRGSNPLRRIVNLVRDEGAIPGMMVELPYGSICAGSRLFDRGECNAGPGQECTDLEGRRRSRKIQTDEGLSSDIDSTVRMISKIADLADRSGFWYLALNFAPETPVDCQCRSPGWPDPGLIGRIRRCWPANRAFGLRVLDWSPFGVGRMSRIRRKVNELGVQGVDHVHLVAARELTASDIVESISRWMSDGLSSPALRTTSISIERPQNSSSIENDIGDVHHAYAYSHRIERLTTRLGGSRFRILRNPRCATRFG